MKNWKIEIKKFDKDLKNRMKVIFRFEYFQFNEKTELIKIRSLMGFPILGARPWWFDNSYQWKRRNSERHNESCRNWRFNNKEKCRERYKIRYLKNIELERLRNRIYYSKLTQEEKEKRNFKRCVLRTKKRIKSIGKTPLS